MYKVFVNERPLILTDKIAKPGDGEYFMMNGDQVKAAVKALRKEKLPRAYVYHPNREEILNKFTEYIPKVVAAGGVVTNPAGKVLFIYRNDTWDLPKGVRKKKEKLKDCAIREVEVHWYAMTTDFDGELVGEESEGIEKVKWKGPKKIRKALEKSYINIRILFEHPTE
ncbi:MAG: NUDIX domain-containing protein [Robiginitalea sp.]